MSQLRLTVGSLRSALTMHGLLTEADDDDEPVKRPKVVRRPMGRRATQDPDLSKAYNELIDALPKGHGGEALPKADEERYQKLLDKFSKQHDISRGGKTPPEDTLYKTMSGTVYDPLIDRPGKPRKEPPQSRPITKDYKGQSIQAPMLKPRTPEQDLEPEQVKAFSRRAFEQIPQGEWHARMKGPYLVLVSVDPTAKMLVWAGVPETNRHPEKPKAWRTVDELDRPQREMLGYLDPRDRAMPKSDVRAQYEKPFGDPVNQVRFKGGAEGRVEPEMTGQSLGAASGPGGIPTPSAQRATLTADLAKDARINWNELELSDLKKYYIIAQKKAKTSQMPEDKRVVDDIAKVIGDRLKGRPQSRVRLPHDINTPETHEILAAFEMGDPERGWRLIDMLPSGDREQVDSFFMKMVGRGLLPGGSDED